MSKLKIAIYGTGNFANKTHIPNILTVPDAEIVAASDVNEDALNSTVQEFGIHRSYADAHEMIDNEEMDVLYSIVPAFARTDVEIRAAQKGIHIFSEKP
ncbi:MAG: Gfo/Idh/MocA family oxidoreductase, partial [Planctomycetota bacterium]|nr:Gfo/Idh/MocA family oxidoreductase [Planctomycetota bacterium]